MTDMTEEEFDAAFEKAKTELRRFDGCEVAESFITETFGERMAMTFLDAGFLVSNGYYRTKPRNPRATLLTTYIRVEGAPEPLSYPADLHMHLREVYLGTPTIELRPDGRWLIRAGSNYRFEGASRDEALSVMADETCKLCLKEEEKYRDYRAFFSGFWRGVTTRLHGGSR